MFVRDWSNVLMVEDSCGLMVDKEVRLRLKKTEFERPIT